MIRKLVISIVAAVAIVGFAWTFKDAKKPDDRPPLPQAIEAVSPQPNDLDLRQVDLAVDLAPGYTGVLYLDNQEIPEDDLRRVPALNQVSLQPQSDSDFKSLAPGTHRATVLYWRLGEPRERADHYTWTFALH